MRHAILVTSEERPFDFTAGRAYWQALAEWLVAAGEQVAVVDARPAGEPALALPAGVESVLLPPCALPLLHVGREAVLAHACDLYLAASNFDTVHAAEHGAALYYALLARGQGLRHQAVRFVVHLRGPSRWRLEASGAMLDRLSDLEADHMEREVVARADHLVSPTHGLPAWMERRGWPVPTAIAPAQAPLSLNAPAASPAPRGWAFVGRLDHVSGLDVFLDALDRLHRSAAGATLPPVSLIVPEEGPGLAAARARLARLGVDTELELVHSLDALLAALAQRQAIAVIPCRNALLPDHALACLATGWRLVVTAAGGLGEIVDGPAPGDSRTLAEHMRAALTDSSTAGTAARAIAVPGSELIARPALPVQPAVPERGDAPLVSVCLTHYNRPAFLAQALDGLRSQTFRDFEVVLVDDGSDAPAALAALADLEPEFAERGWRIVRQENRYLGAARNAAVAAARGTYVLFMDDDNIAKPQQIETFVRAALASGADALTCLLDLVSGDEAPTDTRVQGRLLVAGGAVVEGVFKNCFGDANALVRRGVLLAVGGFSEDRGIGHEDWELFARIALAGYRLEVLPDALVYYRQTGDGMRVTMPPGPSHWRSLRPYLERIPAALADALILAQGLGVRAERDELQIARLTGELDVTHRRAEALDEHGRRLAAHADAQARQIADLRAHTTGLEEHVRALTSHSDALRAHADGLEAHATEVQRERDDLLRRLLETEAQLSATLDVRLRRFANRLGGPSGKA